ncbi:MAG: AAA family ATPase [Prosthecobacter sp.]|nr:AAA family ATPase [Prosthecobacter sp.]
MSIVNYEELSFKIGSVFTPGSPVNEKDLFAGRIDQIRSVHDAVSQQGYHAVLYGERGVGKTSLANIIKMTLPGDWIVPRVNCDGTDTFSTLWRKALRDISFTEERPGIGFNSEVHRSVSVLADTLPPEVTPDVVRAVLQNLSRHAKMLIVFDEFDRLNDPQISVLMADTLKSLSDFSVPATILLIGVADSVDDLVAGHQSVERALIQIPMPRMSTKEINQILKTGFQRIGMNLDDNALDELTTLSQGLPYITHLLSLHSGKAALERKSIQVSSTDVERGIAEALSRWQQTTTKAYYDAVQSSQPGNIYKQVLLACALADTDDMGFFSAAAVRMPLRALTGKDYDIPNFAQHLKNFSEESRGGIISRTGEKRRIRYRFTSPLHRPFIIMKGFQDDLLTRQQMKQMSI